MDKYGKACVMLIIGVLSAIFLVLSKDLEWLQGRIFYVLIAILFFHPMIKSAWGEKRPEGWWIAFIVGLFLLSIYAIFVVGSVEGTIELFLMVTLITVLSAFGNWIANKLRGLNNLK